MFYVIEKNFLNCIYNKRKMKTIKELNIKDWSSYFVE